MNSLLQRQIRKLLAKEGENPSAELTAFLNAVDQSYENFEDQLKMIQRAMSVSSVELEEANKRLRHETERQQEVIKSLNDTINTLREYAKASGRVQDAADDGVSLARLIEDQTQELIRTNKERDMLMKDLERRNKELGDYAHVVSHDLQAPLRGIDALLNFLKEDYYKLYDETGRKNMEGIFSLLEKMDSLIKGILEYAEIAPSEEIKKTVDLDQLVNEVAASAYPPEHIKIKVDSLPQVQGNALRFRQVFQNLIQNAIGAIDKPYGEINVGATDQDEVYKFWVSDNGKGISKKYHDKIFEKFQRIDNKPNSSGIGLPIVEKIIIYYGGEIWLESEEGIGTTFYFTIPK